MVSESYLDAVKKYPFEIVSAACEMIRDTWTNEFKAPLPGTLAATCHRLSSKRRSEIREEVERHRDARMKRERMTPPIMRAELERLRGLPEPEGDFDRRVHRRLILSYEKMLGGRKPADVLVEAASVGGMG